MLFEIHNFHPASVIHWFLGCEGLPYLLALLRWRRFPSVLWVRFFSPKIFSHMYPFPFSPNYNAFLSPMAAVFNPARTEWPNGTKRNPQVLAMINDNTFATSEIILSSTSVGKLNKMVFAKIPPKQGSDFPPVPSMPYNWIFEIILRLFSIFFFNLCLIYFWRLFNFRRGCMNGILGTWIFHCFFSCSRELKKGFFWTVEKIASLA